MNDPKPWSDRLTRLAPVFAGLIVAGGLYLRFSGIGEYWVNPDEGIYYSTLTQPSFARFWSEVMENAHPPGYYLLLRTFGFLTWDFVWLRATSALFGGATIWLMWLVGRELGGPGAKGAVVGLLAAALVAFNGEAIGLSQVIRPYALLIALLTAALYALLVYMRAPNNRLLATYAALLTGALLTHYSAVFGVGVLSVLILHELWSGRLGRGAWWHLVAAHVGAGALIALLYVFHLRGLMSSELATDALDGWLAHWMVSSPGGAWRALVDYQVYTAPLAWTARSAMLLIAAIVLSVTGRDRRVAVLVGTALLIALTASALELYPFGKSRHVTWLVAFTLPALAWLPVGIARLGRKAALVAGLPVVALLLVGNPIESTLAPGAISDRRTNATEERTLRTLDLAPLVVNRLDPQGEPRIILMTEQTYYLMMPLYPTDRHPIHQGRDGRFLHFAYGARHVVVARSWDWEPPFDLASVVWSLDEAVPDVVTEQDRELLVLAGGWGSVLFRSVPTLRANGIIIEESVVLGSTPQGEPVIRLLAATVDREAIDALAGGQDQPPGAASLPSTDSSSAAGS